MEQLQRYAKLSYRVVFPFELRLFNTVSIIDYRHWSPTDELGNWYVSGEGPGVIQAP